MSRMVSIISKKIIKPFTPTPSTQRWHKLSLLDQGLTHFSMPLVFFYPKNQVNAIPNGTKQLSNLLSNSLSKTLSYYHPWAGSLKDNATIECDDHGAEFLEVQINSPMDKVVDSNVKDLTFPQGVPWANGVDRALIVAQLSHFDCGGIALSVCLSHKIGDGSSAYCFLRDWAALTQSSNTTPSPYFVEDSIVPSPIGPLVSPVFGSDANKCVQKRFIFTSTKLSALKSSIGVQNVTSNEAVNALVYKCAASSATTINSGSFKRSQLVQFSDIRGIISPPLLPNTIGNLLTVFSSPIYEKEEELKLPKLVTDIKKSKNDLSTRNNLEFAIEMLDAYRTGEEPFYKRKCDLYFSSSVCKFPFLQDLDFGFGKPIRSCFAKGPFNKFIYLMKTYDGGIEAFVNLNEHQMSVFEHDKQLLEFATPITKKNSTTHDDELWDKFILQI